MIKGTLFFTVADKQVKRTQVVENPRELSKEELEKLDEAMKNRVVWNFGRMV